MKDRLRFLKLLNEFRSKNYELKYVKEVLEEAHFEFEMYHRQWCAENDVDLEELNKRNKRKVAMNFIENKTTELKLATISEKAKEKKDTLKGIYKLIAKKLHPDKLKAGDPRKPEYEEAFKRVTEANQSQKWGDLFDVVDKYDIYLGEYDEAIECLKIDIKRVEEELNKEKSSYSWALYEAESEIDKAQVVKRFLKQLFGWNG